MLRLSADIWTMVTANLPHRSIENLILAGNRTLTHLLSQGVQSISISDSSGSIDTTRLSYILHHSPQLKRLAITSRDEAYFTKPPKPLVLPPKLTSLSVDANYATEFVLTSGYIAELPESLVSLKISGKSTVYCDLGEIKFPSKLSTLELLNSVYSVDKQSIADLPRTLTRLKIDIPRMPEMTRFWPLELSSLTLYTLRTAVILDHLPRTLRYLSLPYTRKLKTSFSGPPLENEFSFPWRSFFPFLEDVKLPKIFKNSIEHLMTCLLSPTAFDAHSVDSFISNGFWGAALPDLCYDPRRTYPYFKRLVLHP